MNKTIEGFQLTIEQRLYEVSRFWSDCDKNYQELDDFVSSLNALIQSLRNLTFIIQSYKSVIPNFDTWYTTKQKEMRNDIYLKWSHDSRNLIVKSSNLKLKSKTTVDLMNWESHPLKSILTDPLTNNSEVVESVLARLSSKKLLDGLRDPIVRVERIWIADNMPDKELLWLTSYCYRYFKKMILDVYKMLGLDLTKIMSNFESNIDITNENELFEGKRAVVFDLKDNKRLNRRHIRVDRNEKDIETASHRYGFRSSQYINKEDDLLTHFKKIITMAKQIIKKDGHHVPMAFLFDDKLESKFYTLAITNRSEIYYIIRKLADEILENRYKGAIIINESWIKNNKDEVKGEAVMIAVIKKGFAEIDMIPFEKNKGKTILKSITKMTDSSNFAYLKPIIDAIEKVG